MNSTLVLLLEKSIEEQSVFMNALERIDSSVTCVASTRYSDILYRQPWNAVFISVDDFIGEGLSFIDKFTRNNRSLVVAIAETTVNKKICAECGMDYFLVKPDNPIGWIDVLKPLFTAMRELQNVLVPFM